jgi:hypothetical protein
MNFCSFGAIFVDFSEARDLFVNIFQTRGSDRETTDCRLILEKGRGLSARWWGFFWFRNYFSI